MSKAKWEQINKEKAEQILNESKSYKEALKKIGYATYSKNNQIIKSLAEKYNIDISHFKHTTLNDLTGLIFGRLQVLERDLSYPTGHQAKVYWKCQCICGNIISVQSNHLKNGQTQSCGCLQKERISETIRLNLIGQRFGKLTVIAKLENIIEKSGQNRTAWLCKCECGKQCIVKTINLRSGDTKSCGCLKSEGEYVIDKLLKKNNIPFKKEYSFDDLRTDKNFLMRFDFAIFDENNTIKYLIEFQGNQHYHETNFPNGIGLKEVQKRDKIKEEYCKSHNLILIVIPCWDIEKISMKYLEEAYNVQLNQWN